MSNILVTGSNGQLGSEIKEVIDSKTEIIENATFYFTNRQSLDINNKENLLAFIHEKDINVIINCAAYTAVDKAQEDEKNSDSINNKAVQLLAQMAKENQIKLIHISTDYVFDGKNYRPYKEDDCTNPQSVYGQTKLAGEKAMMAINPMNSIIIRTSWVYSRFGNNFVKTMLRLGREKEELGVIFDQIGTPTYAKDLAKTIITIVPKIQNSHVEIYHYTNEGVLSWYDFAKEIMKMAKLTCKINPLETYQYPTPVARPHYSVLNKSKIKDEFHIAIPYWKDGLDECLRSLGERK